MINKGRPKKVRYIQKMPQTIQFSPRGKPGRPDEVVLSLDQFEALKLTDYQGFSQTQGAVAMKISRPSFGRILRDARKKVADGLVNGKIIKFRMGDIQIGVRKADLSVESVDQEVVLFQARNRKVSTQVKQLGAVKSIVPAQESLLQSKK